MENTARSPYELRTELLSMAIGILESQSQRRLENEYMLSESNRKAVSHFEVDDVLEVASKLNGFVSKK